MLKQGAIGGITNPRGADHGRVPCGGARTGKGRNCGMRKFSGGIESIA